MFELILYQAFAIPRTEALMLSLNNDAVIIYPLSSLDLQEASQAWKCELQTIPLVATPASVPVPVPVPVAAFYPAHPVPLQPQQQVIPTHYSTPFPQNPSLHQTAPQPSQQQTSTGIHTLLLVSLIPQSALINLSILSLSI
jgi:hypothetical protein